MKWLRNCVATVLRAGPIPLHVAFIMDGNRRFGERLPTQDRAAGHNSGFYKLLEALEWCLELGIKCVSVYAFSIDNFKRSTEEVETLMHLAEVKLEELLQEHKLVKQHGVRVHVVGDLTLLPPAVRTAAERVMRATKDHKKATLNICLAYTSTQEMAHAVTELQTASQELDCPAMSDLESHLYTRGCPPVDLLIRTSGESRLSDFLLLQSSNALLHFSPVLWPDFSFLDLLTAIVSYQRSSPHLALLRQQSNTVAGTALEEIIAAEPRDRQAVLLSKSLTGSDSPPAREPESVSSNSTTSPVTEARHAELAASPAAQPAGNQGGVQGLSGRQVAVADAPCVPSKQGTRLRLDRRKRSQKPVNLDALPLDDSALFLVPEAKKEDRSSQLRAAGIAGGYDSMEDDEEDAPHINGCPCCIVKFLPMHRVCKDPTPAIAAMRRAV